MVLSAARTGLPLDPVPLKGALRTAQRPTACWGLIKEGGKKLSCRTVPAMPLTLPFGGRTPLLGRQRTVRVMANSAAGSLHPAAPELQEAPRPWWSRTAATFKACLFYAFSLTIAVPLFGIMLLLSPFVLLFDRHRRLAQHFVNDLWARLSTLLFYRVTVEGKEFLPAPTEPAIYISNHQSFLDIFTMFHLGRPFKFVSKTSIFLIPIVGWSMWLTEELWAPGHIPLKRLDRRSQMACLHQCQELLQKGASVLFFPEGTRSHGPRMGAFKKGAFSVAAKAKVPVVPITLLGTGDIMPSQQELKMYPGHVRVIIHPRVQPKQADSMLQEARGAVAAALPPELIE